MEVISSSSITENKEISHLPKLSSTNITKEWLYSALKINSSKNKIEKIEAVPILGGTQIPKLSLKLTYNKGQEDDDKNKEDKVNKENYPQNLFIKICLTEEENNKLTTPYSKEIMECVKKSQFREASFYRILNKILNFSQDINITPKCYHASDEVILLDNPILTNNFIVASNWKFNESAIDLDPNIAKGALKSLANLHGSFWNVDLKIKDELMNFEELLNARIIRIQCAGINSNDDELKKLNEICDFYKASEEVRVLCKKIGNLGFKKLFQSVLQTFPHGTLCHGDSNPGNFLIEVKNNKEIPHVLLVDFQEPSMNSPCVNDVARMLISSFSPISRIKIEDELINWYFDCLKPFVDKKGGMDKLRLSLDFALLSDAIFIIYVIPMSCISNPSTKLLCDLFERSFGILRDNCSKFQKMLN